MILTTYLDESGTHAGSPLTLMAGFMGNARQWELFERRFKTLRELHRIKRFHAKEFAHRTGEFKNWDIDKQIEFVQGLIPLMKENTEIGATSILKEDQYKQHYLSNNKPRKLQKDTRYGICFRACSAFFIESVLKRQGVHIPKGKHTIHFVLESGHKNAGDAERVFADMKRTLPQPYRDIMGTISFADKNDCMPLAAADAMAYGMFRKEMGVLPGLAKIQVPAKSNLHRVDLSPRSLERIKTLLLEQDTTRFEHGNRVHARRQPSE